MHFSLQENYSWILKVKKSGGDRELEDYGSLAAMVNLRSCFVYSFSFLKKFWWPELPDQG